MSAVQRHCQSCILLREGKVVLQGGASTVINSYIRDCGANTEVPLHALKVRTGTGAIRLASFHLEDMVGHRVREVRSGSDFDIVLRYSCTNPDVCRKVDVGFSVHLPDETIIAVLYSSYTGIRFDSVAQTGEFRCRIARLPLQQGTYLIGARIVAEGEEADWPRTMIGQIEVLAGDFHGGGTNGYTGSAPLLLSGRWSLR
jgi:lipopolysaccharide transport system ATP-binding protein